MRIKYAGFSKGEKLLCYKKKSELCGCVWLHDRSAVTAQ
jgi:hypothetical protein